MKTHWVADMYPLNESDIEPLAESIKANGQRTPILALKDGTIIDGRNRWLACQKAGVDPIITIINPDGEDVPEDELWAIATDYNSMRRDITSSGRACLVAASYKGFYPNGENLGRGDSKSKVGKNFPTLEQIITKHKSNEKYAKQALAILNYSPDLLDDAKTDLAGTYKTYQARVSEDRTKRQNAKFLDAPENVDIRERVSNSQLAMDEAITLLRKRHDDEIREAENAERIRKQTSVRLGELCDMSIHWTDAASIAESFKESDYSRISKDAPAKCIKNLASVLSGIAAQLENK